MDIISKFGIVFLLGLAGNPIGKYIGSTFFKWGKGKQELLKDPAKRELALKLFVSAQKLFGGDKGKEKFDWVKARFLIYCPDFLDPVVEGFLQGLYNEIEENKAETL